MSMTINELVKEAYETAKEKGWHDEGKEKSALENHMLIVSEIAEATEAVRNPKLDELYPHCYVDISGKPEGELIELVDAIIRIADYCGSKGWDLEQALRLKMDYNKTRSYRHGNKKY